MKILIIALSGIGDALLFTPALQFIKAAVPEAEVEALVMFRGVQDIYERTGLFSRIHYFDFLKQGKRAALSYVLSLRGKYDASISVYPSNRKEYNLISLLIGAEKRAAVSYLRMNTQNLGFLNTVTVKENDSLHNAEENIRLCEVLLGKTCTQRYSLLFPLSSEDKNYAEEFIQKHGLESRSPIIGFHPGCNTLKNHEKRRWEWEKFSELAEKLIREQNAVVLLFGGGDEEELKQRIAERVHHPDCFVVPSKNMGQAAAVMQRCAVFVSNDSGLMHVAAALTIPTVAIIGPTSTNYIYPWETKHRIASLNLECAPCFRYSPKPLRCSRTDTAYKCIKDLSPEAVYREVKNILQK